MIQQAAFHLDMGVPGWWRLLTLSGEVAMHPTIINRGRGPEIAGSRITVYDVLAETEAGASPELLAQWYGLTVEAIHAALRYIEDHHDEVLAAYRQIKERHARGNSPELQAQIDATHAKFQELWADRFRRSHQEFNGEGNPDGH
jgi:uncharacterized protein (DUF433 family)